MTSVPSEKRMSATSTSELGREDLATKKRSYITGLGLPLEDTLDVLLNKKIELFSFLSVEYSAHYPVSKEANKDESFYCCYAPDHRVISTSSKRRKTFSQNGARVSLLEGLIIRSSPKRSVFCNSTQVEDPVFLLESKRRIQMSSKSRIPSSSRRISLINRLRS